MRGARLLFICQKPRHHLSRFSHACEEHRSSSWSSSISHNRDRHGKGKRDDKRQDERTIHEVRQINQEASLLSISITQQPIIRHLPPKRIRNHDNQRFRRLSSGRHRNVRRETVDRLFLPSRRPAVDGTCDAGRAKWRGGHVLTKFAAISIDL